MANEKNVIDDSKLDEITELPAVLLPGELQVGKPVLYRGERYVITAIGYRAPYPRGMAPVPAHPFTWQIILTNSEGDKTIYHDLIGIKEESPYFSGPYVTKFRKNEAEELDYKRIIKMYSYIADQIESNVD